ncbi:MAG: hypothetical protein ACXWLH_06350, partial [Candidatus Saccharimonadales bacterium]
LYVLSQDSPIVHSDAALRNLDITGTDGHATVGQDLSVNIKSPQAMSVMVSYERGRIYKSEWVSLQKGDNTYTVSVDANLAPSFTLAFQYFYNGQYHNEGTTFQVGYPSQKGSITLTPDKSTYKAGDKVSVKIDSKDSDGKGIPTSMIVGVVDNSIFSLNDRVAPDIFTSFYGWRETAINASSSLLGIGSGGGGCGGGGGDGSSFINRSGATLVWDPTLITNSSGTNTISFVAKKGSWRVYVYSANGDTVVASSQIVVSAQ